MTRLILRDYRGARYSIYCKYVGIKFTVIVIISRINIRFALNPRPFAALYTDPALISISPTCGFKVTDRERQGLNYESQWTKIDLLKQAAAKIAE